MAALLPAIDPEFRDDIGCMLPLDKAPDWKCSEEVRRWGLNAAGSSHQGYPGGSVVKNLPAMQEPWVRSLGGEDPLEEGPATHSSLRAWSIP